MSISLNRPVELTAANAKRNVNNLGLVNNTYQVQTT